jgi:hypothetical protein
VIVERTKGGSAMPRPATHRPHIIAEIQKAGDQGVTTSEIAERLGYNLPQVYKDVKYLEEKGLIRRAGKGEKGGDLLVWVGPASNDAPPPSSPQPTQIQHGRVIAGEGIKLGARYQVMGMGIIEGGTEIVMQGDEGEMLTVLLA